MNAPLFTAGESLDSREALILAAEKLFSIRGIEAVSLRQLAKAGGHGNNNAVRYHFGSKLALVRAIFDYRVTQMEPIRERMLAAAERKGAGDDLRQLIEMIFLPYLLLRDGDGTFPYVGFLMHYLIYERPRGMTHIADNGNAPCLQRILRAIYAKLAFLPPDVAERRLMSASLIVETALVNNAGRIGNDSDFTLPQALPQLLHDVFGEVTAMMAMPWTGPVSTDFAARTAQMLTVNAGAHAKVEKPSA
jgi:AcrR family transcriptional regulator